MLQRGNGLRLYLGLNATSQFSSLKIKTKNYRQSAPFVIILALILQVFKLQDMDDAGNEPNHPAAHILIPPRSPEQVTRKIVCPGAPVKKGTAFIKEVISTFAYYYHEVK